MSAWRSTDPRALKMETLETQRQHLLLLREHHQRWMNEADDPKISRLHADVIDSISVMEARCATLLRALQAQRDKE
jgi:hypothetical protein